jgi:hypothetical protein
MFSNQSLPTNARADLRIRRKRDGRRKSERASCAGEERRDMTIPKHTVGGKLPPFLGAEPGGQKALQSPYRTTLEEFIAKFATSDRRRTIADGLIRFRRELRSVGLTAIQWLDGSYIDVMSREPNDVDVVSLIQAPAAWDKGIPPEAAEKIAALTDRPAVKAKYSVDALYVELGGDQVSLAREIAYWYGLFSHARETFAWRGILEVELASADDDGGAFDILTLMTERAAASEDPKS